jgi:hypothetical protein
MSQFQPEIVCAGMVVASTGSGEMGFMLYMAGRYARS